MKQRVFVVCILFLISSSSPSGILSESDDAAAADFTENVIVADDDSVPGFVREARQFGMMPMGGGMMGMMGGGAPSGSGMMGGGAGGSGGGGGGMFVPLTMISSLTGTDTFTKLLKSPSSSGALTAAELREATQLVFNMTDKLTAICHLQFHPPFKITNSGPVIRSQTQNDFPIPNGFIHIEPPDRRQDRTVLEIISGHIQLSRLYKAIQVVPGLPEYLACNSPVTMFAPNDEAFEAFGIDRLNILMRWPDAMQEILTNMIATNGSLSSVNWADDTYLQTLNSYGKLVIKISDDGILRILNVKTSPVTPSEKNRPSGLFPVRAREDQVLVLQTDLSAVNGVVHIVDYVLNPPVPSMNDTVAQIFPLHPYMPLQNIQVNPTCKQVLADMLQLDTGAP